MHMHGIPSQGDDPPPRVKEHGTTFPLGGFFILLEFFKDFHIFVLNRIEHENDIYNVDEDTIFIYIFFHPTYT